MNIVIRVLQVILGFTALNQVYGLTLSLTFNAVYRSGLQSNWDIMGSIVSVLVYFLIIFFLQRYYEKRNNQQSNTGRFTKITLSLLGIVIFLAVGIVVLIVIMAFSKLG